MTNEDFDKRILLNREQCKRINACIEALAQQGMDVSILHYVINDGTRQCLAFEDKLTDFANQLESYTRGGTL